MKTAKQEAIELIERMPEETSFETILAGLHFKQKRTHENDKRQTFPETIDMVKATEASPELSGQGE